MKQTSFQKTQWAYRFSHGGTLRKRRAGRTARPISTKEPIHLVLKANQGLSGAGLRSARRFSLVQHLLRKYSKKFHVKVEQVSVQFDHVHLLVRVTRRSLFQHFLRVLSGQIAQQFQVHGLSLKPSASPGKKTLEINPNVEASAKEPAENPRAIGPAGKATAATDTPKLKTPERRPKLWKYRPFTRVVRGWRAYKVVRDYIALNEKESTGEIRYSKTRLRGLTEADKALLRAAWS